jgi:hypothetical protein
MIETEPRVIFGVSIKTVGTTFMKAKMFAGLVEAGLETCDTADLEVCATWCLPRVHWHK